MKKWESHFELGDTVTAEQLNFFDSIGGFLKNPGHSADKVMDFWRTI